MVVVAPLIALGTFALVMWLIALALAIAVVMGYISGILHGLPFPLNQLAGPVHSLAQGITNVAGKIEAGADHLIGASWHMLARYLDQQWHQLVWSAHALAQAAESIWRLTFAHIHLRSVVHHAVGSIGAVVPRVKTLEKEWHGIEHRVKTLERDITKGIGHDLRIQVKALEHDVTKIEQKAIPEIRADVATAGGDITALRKWITRNFPAIGTTALVGAVAWALAQLGLGGLRCPSFGRLLSKWGCGLGGLLDALLGLAISALALENVCALLPIAETAFGDVVGPVTHLLTEVPLGGCETPPKGWPTLSVATGPLPPPQTLGQLAA